MKFVAGKLLVLLVCFAIGVPSYASGASGGPVVVELFTSEGCSSCPPADALLGKLDRERNGPGPQVIVLGEHVDYWNGLGWKDRFSSAEFSRRQSEYEKRFSLNSVYTPQIVIDGRYQLVGNNESGVRDRISEAAQKPATTTISLFWNKGAVVVKADNQSGHAEDMFLAITENDLSTSVARGENSGRTLNHTGVVRTLRKIGQLSGGRFHSTIPITFQPGWKPENLRIVVFAQSEPGGEISGASALDALDRGKE